MPRGYWRPETAWQWPCSRRRPWTGRRGSPRSAVRRGRHRPARFLVPDCLREAGGKFPGVLRHSWAEQFLEDVQCEVEVPDQARLAARSSPNRINPPGVMTASRRPPPSIKTQPGPFESVIPSNHGRWLANEPWPKPSRKAPRITIAAVNRANSRNRSGMRDRVKNPLCSSTTHCRASSPT
ncbi:hypothetical protein D3C80_1562220 [compost metagenome]